MQATRTERSRDQILDAAQAIFQDQDFASTSVEEIAQRAGLTRKTVYNLFSSKEEIVVQLRARAEARYYPPIRARIASDHAALAILEDTLIGHGVVFENQPGTSSVSERMMRSGLTVEPSGRPSPCTSIQIE